MPAIRGIVPSLNGLRALSIAIVFLSHTVSYKLFPGGFGVRVFFLISGFLITRLLFLEWKKKGRIALGKFYTRRFLRLYPLLVVFTIVILAAFLVFRPTEICWAEPVSALLYISNFYYSYLSQIGKTDQAMPFAIFWSLSVEEHFYIVFPLLFVLLRADAARLTWACIIVIVACLTLRLSAATADPGLVNSYALYYETQYQVDSIMFGVLLGALCEFEKGQVLLRRLFSVAAVSSSVLLLIASFAIRDVFFRETIRYSMLSASIFIFVTNIIFSEKYHLIQKALNSRAMDWIGRLSYSIYLWHYAVRQMIHVDGEHYINVLVWLLATLALSSASYYLLEQPMSSLRHRFGSMAPQRALN